LGTKEKIMKNIQNTVRKNIKLLSEHKKRVLAEESIIKGRFGIIVEKINPKSRLQINRAITQLFSEIKYLNTQGFNPKLINENVIDILSKMFAEEGEKFMGVIKSKLAEYLETKLGVTEFEKGVLEKAIGDTEMDDVPKLFSDARFLADKLADVYGQTFDDKFSSEFSDITRPMISMSDNPDTKRKMADKFYEKLSPIMGDINSNMETKLRGFRDKLIA